MHSQTTCMRCSRRCCACLGAAGVGRHARLPAPTLAAGAVPVWDTACGMSRARARANHTQSWHVLKPPCTAGTIVLCSTSASVDTHAGKERELAPASRAWRAEQYERRTTPARCSNYHQRSDTLIQRPSQHREHATPRKVGETVGTLGRVSVAPTWGPSPRALWVLRAAASSGPCWGAQPAGARNQAPLLPTSDTPRF